MTMEIQVAIAKDAVLKLADEVRLLGPVVTGAAEHVAKPTEELSRVINQGLGAQGRQQRIVIALTIVIALSTVLYTWITYQSVQAMREANQIQRQSLERQKADVGGGGAGTK